jgi:hypothetical protein
MSFFGFHRAAERYANTGMDGTGKGFTELVALPLARKPERVCCCTNSVSETIEHFASNFELSCLALCPLLSGFSQAMVSCRDVSGGGFGQAGIGQGCLESALRFR